MLLDDVAAVKDPQRLLASDTSLAGAEQRVIPPRDPASPCRCSNGRESDRQS